MGYYSHEVLTPFLTNPDDGQAWCRGLSWMSIFAKKSTKRPPDSHGLTTTDLHEIIRTVKDGHFHVACTRVFEITHADKGFKEGDGIGDGESVTHPN